MTIEGLVSRAVSTTNAAIAKGGYWLAMVLLAAGVVNGLLIFSDRLVEALPLFIGYALVAAAGTLLHLDIGSRPSIVAVASLTGATGVWAAGTATGSLSPHGGIASSVYFFSDLTVAIVFLGTLLWRSGRAALSVTVCFAVTQLIVMAAVVTAGGRAVVDLPALAVWAVVTSVLISVQLQRRRSRITEPDFLHAATRTQVSAQLRNASLQRVAMLHDTVLNDLAAIALLPPGPLAPRALARFADTLDVVTQGIERPVEGTSGTSRAALVEILGRRPPGAVPIEVSGDASALNGMDQPEREALLLALAQSVANIDRHAQASSAELFIGSSGTDVTVMVSDDGVGFDPALVSPDRLGLKSSIRARLEAVDGRGEVWSSPGGGGTTVVLTAPLRGAPAREQSGGA